MWNYKIFSILTLSLVIGFIWGCRDTFGTDPNVRITELSPSTPSPGDTINNPIQLTTKWNFVEYFSMGPQGSSMTWGTNYKLLKDKFIIDTTQKESKVWLDIEAISTIPDDAINNRKDRIVSMRLIVDSLTIPNRNNEIVIDEERNKLIRLELVVKDFRNNRKYIINDKELGLIFSIQQEDKNKPIRGFLNADLGEYIHLNTFNFQAIFQADFK